MVVNHLFEIHVLTVKTGDLSRSTEAGIEVSHAGEPVPDQLLSYRKLRIAIPKPERMEP